MHESISFHRDPPAVSVEATIQTVTGARAHEVQKSPREEIKRTIDHARLKFKGSEVLRVGEVPFSRHTVPSQLGVGGKGPPQGGGVLSGNNEKRKGGEKKRGDPQISDREEAGQCWKRADGKENRQPRARGPRAKSERRGGDPP